MNRRDFGKGMGAALALVASPLSLLRKARAGGATPVFSYPDFSSKPSDIAMGDAEYAGSALRLIIADGHYSGSAFYKTQQQPTAFTTQFTFQPVGLTGSGVLQSGMTFCIQNVSPAYGGDANMCGYGGALDQYPPIDSIAIKFDAGNQSAGQAYPAGGMPSSTGLYFNGGPSIHKGGGSVGLCPELDLNPHGISFYSGHSYGVTIVYDGSLLTMVLVDTTTNAQARLAWPLNLANTTNPTGSYVGFTAGTSQQGYFDVHRKNDLHLRRGRKYASTDRTSTRPPRPPARVL